MTTITEAADLVPMGQANTILLDTGPDLVLVDAGFPGKAALVLDAIRTLGRSPRDLRHLVSTHGHPDHIGSAAAIVRETGATTYMHAADVSLAETGSPFRPMTAPPSLLLKVMHRLVWHPEGRMEPFRIDRQFADGETWPVAGGLRVIHTPGHCAGHVSLLRQGERLLIAGNVGMNIVGLGDPVGFDDIEEGRRRQRKLAGLRFDAAVFGHGRVIHSGASDRVHRKWGRD